MRNIILLLLTLSSVLCYSQQQSAFTYKVQYLPEYNYFQTIDHVFSSALNYTGSDDFLQTLESKGVANPMITGNESKVESVSKIGKLNSENQYPMIIEFLKASSSDGKQQIPDGTLIYGHGALNSLPTLDSIVSPTLDESYKKILLTAIQSGFSQLPHHEQYIKVGEEFTVNAPLNIPIMDIKVEMTISTTYKLISIIDEIAYFELEQQYTLRSELDKSVLRATGSGKGSMKHDIVRNFNIEYQLETLMNMDCDWGIFGVYVDSKSAIQQKVVLIESR